GLAHVTGWTAAAAVDVGLARVLDAVGAAAARALAGHAHPGLAVARDGAVRPDRTARAVAAAVDARLVAVEEAIGATRTGDVHRLHIGPHVAAGVDLGVHLAATAAAAAVRPHAPAAAAGHHHQQQNRSDLRPLHSMLLLDGVSTRPSTPDP